MQFFHGTKIDFMSKRNFFFYFSLSLIGVGLLLVLVLGVKYGIDFKGGSEIAVKFSQDIHTDQIRNVVDNLGMKGSEIKSYGKENQFLIRVEDTGDINQKLTDGFKTAFSNNEMTILKSDKIGPKIGNELKWQAFLAVFISLLAILIYVAFRFEYIYGLGAIIALIHDVIVTFALIVIVNHFGVIDLNINQQILAAMLTVIGFSINDTVIIFDRIRENKSRHKSHNFVKLCNISINETLSRTINTVLTVVLVLITLVFLGGPVLQGFAFTMLIGIITGTYSSIYIASAYVVWHMERFQKVKFDEDAKDTKAINPIKA